MVECRTFNPGVLGSNPNTLKWRNFIRMNIPQLDFLSFHSQLFWVLVFSYLLYFVCLNFFIKEMSKTTKLRVKLVSLLKKIFSSYYARYFLESRYAALRNIKTRKIGRKNFIYRNAIRYQKSTLTV